MPRSNLEHVPKIFPVL